MFCVCRKPSWLRLCPHPATGASDTLKRPRPNKSWKRKHQLSNCEFTQANSFNPGCVVLYCVIFFSTSAYILHLPSFYICLPYTSDYLVHTSPSLSRSQVTELNSRLQSAEERSRAEREELRDQLHQLSAETASTELHNQRLKVDLRFISVLINLFSLIH